MLNVAELKIIAEKDREVENQAKKVKYEKDLAKYRNRLKEVKPKLMKYIEECIYNGLKYNSKIGLYAYTVYEMFKPINKYGINILVLLAKPEYEAKDAYDVSLKELAEEIRKELFGAGVKKIIKSEGFASAYLYLEI